jgi:hypothetical protein
MSPAFGTRGMVHWHALCWRSDREPHNLLHNAIEIRLLDPDCANVLSQWATEQFGLSASHPAGKYETGKPRKNIWPPPEGSAALPAEDKIPNVDITKMNRDKKNLLFK